VARTIVVAFRMSPAGMTPGPEGNYLSRARSLCVRGEALGGRLVAWNAAQLAMGWSTDSIEEAVLFATSIREEALSRERAWASGMAEGELETLSPDGEGILAWGPALIVAVSLADVAAAGEVLVDGDVGALRAGQLSLLGAQESVDKVRRVRGWRLDLDHPWHRRSLSDDGRPIPQAGPVAPPDTASGDKANEAPLPPGPPRAEPPSEPTLTARIRKFARNAEDLAAVDALSQLRRARARAEGGPLSARCQASLALAWTLTMAGRAEEALLETLDALARAREAGDPKAISACMALLVKLYAGVGLADAASVLRESVEG
jgi:hypothetical protein